MSKERTIEKIENELINDNLGKARDRLHGLISTYPDDLSLRVKLAEIYHRLKFPQMSGRYWYLEEKKTKEMEDACLSFEQSCGNNAFQLLSALRFRGNIDTIASDFAREKLLSLQKECKDKFGYYPDYTLKKKDQRTPSDDGSTKVAIIALSVICFVIISAIIGIIVIIKWIINLF